MVVLGVGVVSVMKAFSACSMAVGVIRGRTVAMNFAAGMMSEARCNPELLVSEDEGIFGGDYPGFTWRRQLRATNERGVVAVKITVEWKTQGIARDFSLVSLVEEP